jgi:hypothetical protein
MSFFVGGAVLASTAVSAYSSNKASKEQSKGIQKGIDASAALAQQARDDVNRLFQQGAAQGRAGLEGAFNFYRQAAPQRMAPVTQGFQQGVNVLGQGAQQANNAILGLPVDMSFTNQQVQQAPTGYMDQAQLAQAPILGVADAAAEQPTVEQSGNKSGNAAQFMTPLGYVKDPIGGAKAAVNRAGSSSLASKAIKKIF